MKNQADRGGCYSPRPSPSVDNTLLDLLDSSYPTQPRSLIAKSQKSRVMKNKGSAVRINRNKPKGKIQKTQPQQINWK